MNKERLSSKKTKKDRAYCYTAQRIAIRSHQRRYRQKPKATDQVRCHYEGTLVDGTLFDSSIQRGEPAVFGVNQVIPGWVEALQLMSEGAKWKLYIPSDLGYGARGAGEMIPPHSTLVFEVELLEVL